jgi:hypothetical protein
MLAGWARTSGSAVAACLALSCSDRLELGSDVLWSDGVESGDFSRWAADASQAVLLPSGSKAEVTSTQRRTGRRAIELVNPAAWQGEEVGPELLHDAGPLDDAFYSAWFLLPEDYRIEPALALMQLRSRDEAGELTGGEQLQLRSVQGGYALLVFNNNAAFLQAPVAEQAPLIRAGSWFQVEARYARESGGRLRVWLDGQLCYDLDGRPGSAGSDVVLSVSNSTERSTPAPVHLFVDDVAISASRVSPTGQSSFD